MFILFSTFSLTDKNGGNKIKLIPNKIIWNSEAEVKCFLNVIFAITLSAFNSLNGTLVMTFYTSHDRL